MKPAILRLFFLLAISQNAVFAQTKDVETQGYDKASYTTEEAGAFMKNWLIAGPVAVSRDTVDPGDAHQEKVFKTDSISGVLVTAGKPVPPVLINEKSFQWQLINGQTDIVDLDSFYDHRDFVYGYALAEIKTITAKNVILALGSDDG
ncbi:MAG: hypothetical protein WKI04_20125, partial [Ferruginibacter sp.]